MDDPTIRGHESFRNLLQAFARPGAVRHLHPDCRDGDEAVGIVAECLLDAECSIGSACVELDGTAVLLARRTGCRRVDAALADFVLAGSGVGAALATLRTGDPDYPDRGATEVYRVESVSDDGGDWLWSGPGVATSRSPRIDGLDAGELAALREINSAYPQGVDALFVARDGAILAMPRSTRLERKA